MRTTIVFAVVCLFAACTEPTPQQPNPTNAMSARKAVGHGPVASMTITPTSLALTVGSDPATVTATYFDKKGNAFAPTNQPTTYWGCTNTYPECNAIAQINPSIGGGTATITPLSPGTFTLYADDGEGHHAEIQVTVS